MEPMLLAAQGAKISKWLCWFIKHAIMWFMQRCCFNWRYFPLLRRAHKRKIQCNLASHFAEGRLGNAVDIKKALMCWEQAASDGCRKAMFKIGSMYSRQDYQGVTDIQKAVYYWEQAADLGYIAAMLNLGALYRIGRDTIKQDKEKAWYYMRAAANAGNSDAQFHMGCMHQDEGRIGSAVWYFKKAASAGESTAFLKLGGIYESGSENIAVDLGKSAVYYEQAVKVGKLVEAMFRLGVIASKRNQNAIKYFELASQEGHLDATYHIGLIFLNGTSFVSVNKHEALKYLRLAANRGHKNANLELGSIYEHGLLGGTPDIQKAVAFYERIGQGERFGMLSFKDGNSQTASDYWKQATKPGDILALFNSLLIHEAINIKKAIACYKTAANLRNQINSPSNERYIVAQHSCIRLRHLWRVVEGKQTARKAKRAFRSCINKGGLDTFDFLDCTDPVGLKQTHLCIRQLIKAVENGFGEFWFELMPYPRFSLMEVWDTAHVVMLESLRIGRNLRRTESIIPYCHKDTCPICLKEQEIKILIGVYRNVIDIPSTHIDEGEFSELRSAGKGGQGQVYFATVRRSGLGVALKKYLDTNKEVLSMRSEICNLQLFRESLNFIEWFGHTTINGELYLVMEASPLGDLATLLSKIKSKNLPQPPLFVAIKWMYCICCGLFEMHQSRLQHEDVKPNNLLLVDSYTRLKLADLGSCQRAKYAIPVTYMETHDAAASKHVDVNVSVSAHGGNHTLAYSAPEVLSAKQPSVESDIFSFGKTCVEILTCEPRSMYDDNETILQSLSIPLQLLKMIKGCLKSKRRERPTAQTCKNILENLMVNHPWSDSDFDEFVQPFVGNN